MADLREAKRRTLREFNDKLIALPLAWKSKRLDALVPSPGLYVDNALDPSRFNATIRREADDTAVYTLPTLSADGNVVLIPEEDFEPAQMAWISLGGPGIFPGRGGQIILVIAAIDKLLSYTSTQTIAAKQTSYSSPTTWPYWAAGFVGAGGLVALLVWAARRK